MLASGVLGNAICPACESRDAKFAFVKSGYSHYRCRSCGSFYIWPTPAPADLARIYVDEKPEKVMSKDDFFISEESHRHLWDSWRYLLALAGNYSGHGPLLDIGCGGGQFLAFADKLGWKDLSGIEIMPEAAEAAKQLTKARIYNNDVSVLPLPGGSFSVITSFDVIEHLSDIHSFLKRVFYLLKPGGIVVIGTFNVQGITMRLLKEKSLTVIPPQHVVLLTKRGLGKALKQAGFEVKRQWSFSVYIREYVRFLRKDKDGGRRNYQTSQTRMTSSRFFLFLMKIADFFLNLTNLGDEFYTIAQKPFNA